MQRFYEKKIKKALCGPVRICSHRLFALGPEGRILEVNPAGAKLLGRDRPGLIDQKLTEFVAEDFHSGFLKHCKKVFESGSRTMRCGTFNPQR
jgi:PAS domain S-box-containing protein